MTLSSEELKIKNWRKSDHKFSCEKQLVGISKIAIFQPNMHLKSDWIKIQHNLTNVHGACLRSCSHKIRISQVKYSQNKPSFNDFLNFDLCDLGKQVRSNYLAMLHISFSCTYKKIWGSDHQFRSKQLLVVEFPRWPPGSHI